jgi:hypothetical protein
MALQGFSEGFASGFGMVNKAYDDKRRRDNETSQTNDLRQYRADTIDYNQDKLEFDREKQVSDADYQTKSLTAQSANQQSMNRIREMQATNAGVSANTGLLNAQSTARKLDGAMTPEEEANKVLVEARGRLVTTQGQQEVANLNRQNSALRLNDILDLASKPVESQEDVDRLTNLVLDSSREKGGDSFFDISMLTSQNRTEAEKGFSSAIRALATNPQADFNAAQTNAISDMFGLTNANYTGKPIDGSVFVNAPVWTMGNTVVGTGLYQGKLNAPANPGEAPTVGGRMFVMTKTPDGDIVPYFPEVTKFRNPSTSQTMNLDLNKFMQSGAGLLQMGQALKRDPQVKRKIDDSAIQLKYGNNKGDTGQVAYRQAVDAELKAIELAIKNNGTDASFSYTLDGENLQELFGQRQEVLRERIADRLLRGIKPNKDVQTVQNWLDANSKALSEIPIPGTVRGANGSPLSRRGMANRLQTLGDIKALQGLTDGTADPTIISYLSTLFNQDGTMRKTEAEFIKILNDKYQADL